MNDNQLMRASEVCEYLSIAQQTLDSWIYQGKLTIPFYKVGGQYRFKREDVLKIPVPVNPITKSKLKNHKNQVD